MRCLVLKASMTINLLKDLTVRFEAGGRHHIILKVDGKTIIDYWAQLISTLMRRMYR